MMYGGIRIVESPFCIRRIYVFPVSKNRSKRTLKKLLHKHGFQWYEEPAAYLTADKIIAHPEIIKQMFETNQIVGFRS